MRILLTGAAGFVGSHLTDRFLTDGHEVIGVDNLSTGRYDNLAHLADHPRFYFIEHDVCQPLRIDQPLDWIMHFASPASPPRYLEIPVATMLVNGEGTHHLLEEARRHKASFFLASTSEVYGDPLVHPQPESYWGHVNPNGPRSIYDEAKRYAEALTLAYHREHAVDIRIIRIFNTYGPRMDPNDGRVITNFINQALRNHPLTVYGNGSQTRSFQYINDLVEGICRLMQVPYHTPVNLGNPEEFTMLELANFVKAQIGSQSEIIFCSLPQDDPKQRKPNINIAQELLGWCPQTELNDGRMATTAHFHELRNSYATVY
jgi:nucleoside-diphosphate-sugar epimerase